MMLNPLSLAVVFFCLLHSCSQLSAATGAEHNAVFEKSLNFFRTHSEALAAVGVAQKRTCGRTHEMPFLAIFLES
jgi:hypothetical protein